MPVFIILIFASYLLGNIYVFVRGLQALGHLSSAIRVIFCIVYLTLALLLIVMMLLRGSKQIPASLAHILFQLGSGWLVFILYMVIFLACADLLKVFNQSFQYGFHISLLLTLCILTYGYINYQHPKKQVINIAVNKPVSQQDQLKIVAISDWHLGFGTNNKRLKKDVDRINAEKPDIILIAGDLIDNSVTPVITQEMDKEINRLYAPMGVYMAPGNHEYISGIDQSIDFIRKTTVSILKDSMVTLPCGLQIIGRDDISNRYRMSAKEWANLTDASKPIILIDHQPNQLADAQLIKADLQLSGHTHDGQFFPFTFVTNRLFELSYGYKKTGDTHYYVTSGIALWGPPFRIGTNSEIVVFECSFIPR